MSTQVHDSAQAVLDEMRQLGMQVRAEGDKVLFRPPEAMPWDLRLRLRECKAEVLALLAREAEQVAWRVERMRYQVPARGPIPFLVARQWAPGADKAGRCMSCAEPLAAGRKARCAACVRAIEIVLNEAREGVASA